MRLTKIVCLTCCTASLALSTAPARAETVRLAVVVGNNQGEVSESALRFAESDAAKLARVLSDLGGVAQSDLYLLQGRPVASLRATFDRIGERIDALHRVKGTRTLLIFYFSGHSDGESLELGADRLPFGELRRSLEKTGADLRLAIVDSCRSGALLAAKGGTLKAPFEIRFADDLPTKGTVLLTSSAANEDALESRELRGSFFTHHLVSGLRGAADASGDGRITLAEAYRYSYMHTVAATSDMVAGAQHPEYDMRLSGMGEVVLTELARPSALLELPAGFDRALIADPFRDEILAEVPRGAPARIALPPGDYLLRLWRANTVWTGRAVVRAQSTRAVAWSELVADHAGMSGGVAAKGGTTNDALAAAQLGEAISSFERLDDTRAVGQFQELLRKSPPKPIAAKAHLYLGLMALNRLQSDAARAEWVLALGVDPLVELPANSSPKAVAVFGEARAERNREIAGQVAVGPATANPPLVVFQTDPKSTAVPTAALEAAPPAPHSHTLSYGLIVAGSVLVAAGIAGAVDVAAYQGMAGTPGNPSHYTGTTLQTQQAVAQVSAILWIPLVIAGGLAGGGAVLAW